MKSAREVHKTMQPGLRARLIRLCVLGCLGFGSADAQNPPAPATDVPSTTERSERQTCDDGNDGGAMIDRIRSRLFRWTCSSASWFDGLFGDERYEEEYRATHGTLTTGTVWSQREQWQELIRFRARLYLPQANRRFHAFVGRVDSEDFISESQASTSGLPRVFDRQGRDSTLVGVGFNEGYKQRGSFDVSSGVRVTFPLDPYVKGSYSLAQPIGERILLRLRETAFWQSSEKFGVTSRIDWDYIVGDRHLWRSTATGTFSQVSEGVRWFAATTLYHFIAENRALAYELAANGSTDRAVPLTDYGVSLIYRQRIWRDWLLIEIRGGVDWPREFVDEQRHSNLNAGLAFELRFGQESVRDQDRN